LIYGIVALSLTFLASYGGFISLAQTMLAGVAGYTVAMLAPTAIPLSENAVPYAVAIPIALVAATIAGGVVGLIAVRTRDIYLLMITLALAVGFSLFAQSNIDLFHGYEGIRNVVGPVIFGYPFRTHFVFYHVSLITAALLYFLVLYVVRTPFGLALQGFRDNPRRVAAVGFNVAVHRVAAFALAGFIAGCGGILITFYNIGITPGSIGITATVNVLVMAVIGGLGHPIGAQRISLTTEEVLAAAPGPRATAAERGIVQRVGQDLFRAALMDYWGGRCAVTGCAEPLLLRASHILAASGGLNIQLNLAGLDQSAEYVLALLTLQELGPPGDLVAGQADRTSALDQPQDLLVIGLGPVFGDVPLGLGDHGGEAALNHQPGPRGILQPDHRRLRVGAHRLDQRDLQLGEVLADQLADVGQDDDPLVRPLRQHLLDECGRHQTLSSGCRDHHDRVAVMLVEVAVDRVDRGALIWAGLQGHAAPSRQTVPSGLR
jgi:ABC-type branched-subunit amino acid transport system permease subunit